MEGSRPGNRGTELIWPNKVELFFGAGIARGLATTWAKDGRLTPPLLAETAETVSLDLSRKETARAVIEGFELPLCKRSKTEILPEILRDRSTVSQPKSNSL